MEAIINYRQLAKEFWNNSVVGQSIIIQGQEQGIDFLATLEECDKEENMLDDGKGLRRKRQRPKNAIGGYLAQKLFRWQMEIRPVNGNGIKHYTVWRLQ